jgi:branched-chain amino acid transport system permease protein
MSNAISASVSAKSSKHLWVAFAIMTVILAVAPMWVYPVFLMKVMCFALFASAFNLLLGFGGLLSFGHAMFMGSAGYVAAHSAKVWGLPPEVCVLLGTAASAVLALVVKMASRPCPVASCLAWWTSKTTSTCTSSC